MTLDKGFESLVDGARQGSYPAWTQVGDELGPSVVAYLTLRGVVDPFSATGDVFIDLAGKLQHFVGTKSSFLTLVFSIAHARLEIEQRYSKLRFQSGRVQRGQAQTSSTEQAFDELPAEQADVLGLRFVGGLDIGQTSEVLWRTESDVLSAESAGLLELQRAMQPPGGIGGAEAAVSDSGEDLTLYRELAESLVSRVNRPSDHFILTCAARAAEEARALHEAAATLAEEEASAGFVERVRMRATALAAAAAMVLGLTGVAWAADGAVPGDWYYGIDRALEAIGIGAGGAEERLQEIAATRATAAEDRPSEPEGSDRAASTSQSVDSTGNERAAEVVSARETGSEQSLAVSDRVADLLRHLAAGEDLSGQEIAEMAKTLSEHLGKANQPDNPGRPDDPGRRDDPGRPDNPGRGSTGRP